MYEAIFYFKVVPDDARLIGEPMIYLNATMVLLLFISMGHFRN